jgi:hypothetical protein
MQKASAEGVRSDPGRPDLILRPRLDCPNIETVRSSESSPVGFGVWLTTQLKD